MYDDIKNKRVLVVGASKGIGRELCHAIDQLGGHVQAASRDIATLSSGLAHTGIANDQLFSCDIQQPGSILNLVQNLSPVDAVCITAGATKLVPKQMIKRQIIDSQLSVNLWPDRFDIYHASVKKGQAKSIYHHYECIRSLQRRESDCTLRGGKERFSSSEQISCFRIIVEENKDKFCFIRLRFY